MENKRKGNANSENTDNVYVKEGNDSGLEVADMDMFFAQGKP